MSLIEDVARQSGDLRNSLITWRRHFHTNPEIGLDVRETAGYIRSLLRDWNIRLLDNSPPNSIVALLPGDSAGDPMALRADMDALGIPEKSRVAFASATKGRMHACGHDGHMAMLLGAAEILRNRPLPQDTYLVFQPGEEDPGGAEPIMQSGLLDPVKGIFAIHLDPSLQSGTVAANLDRSMAATDNFHILIKGRGGHAALPHQSVDPIAMAAQIINSFQFIVSRLIDPVHPAVITLGTIQGGYRPNAIPEEVALSGTIRTFSTEIREQIREEIYRTTAMFCRRYGGDFECDIVPGYPPVINDPPMATYILNLAQDLPGVFRTETLESPRMTAEDFSYYLQTIPGAFYWLGCSPDPASAFPLHHSRFTLDEEVLPLGAALHAAAALNFQERHKDK